MAILMTKRDVPVMTVFNDNGRCVDNDGIDDSGRCNFDKCAGENERCADR
jgi:hypothetical protein